MKTKLVIVALVFFLIGLCVRTTNLNFKKKGILDILIEEKDYSLNISFKDSEITEVILLQNYKEEIEDRVKKVMFELIGDLVLPPELKGIIDGINQEKLEQKMKLMDEFEKDKLKI